MDYAVI